MAAAWNYFTRAFGRLSQLLDRRTPNSSVIADASNDTAILCCDLATSPIAATQGMFGNELATGLRCFVECFDGINTSAHTRQGTIRVLPKIGVAHAAECHPIRADDVEIDPNNFRRDHDFATPDNFVALERLACKFSK